MLVAWHNGGADTHTSDAEVAFPASSLTASSESGALEVVALVGEVEGPGSKTRSRGGEC